MDSELAMVGHLSVENVNEAIVGGREIVKHEARARWHRNLINQSHNSSIARPLMQLSEQGMLLKRTNLEIIDHDVVLEAHRLGALLLHDSHHRQSICNDARRK